MAFKSLYHFLPSKALNKLYRSAFEHHKTITQIIRYTTTFSKLKSLAICVFLSKNLTFTSISTEILSFAAKNY
jgi:hypothetical protein